MGVREDHIELVKHASELIEQAEFDQLRPFLTEDVVWTGALTRPVQGADQMIAEMKKFEDQFGVNTKFESADYFGDESQVVSHEHFRLTRGERTLEGEGVHIFEFTDGKVSKVTVFTGDPQRMAAFFA